MIKKEVIIFLIVGLITVLIDFFFYQFFLNQLLIALDYSKTLGFICGTIFSYIANRFWTFGHNFNKINSLWRFLIIYLVSLLLNVKINSYLIFILGDRLFNFEISFLIATAISALTNFLGMKFFVFKSSAKL